MGKVIQSRIEVAGSWEEIAGTFSLLSRTFVGDDEKFWVETEAMVIQHREHTNCPELYTLKD